MIYEKCLIPVKARSITHKTGDFKVFWYHKCSHKTVMTHARGQNKFFQNASHLICFFNFATGYFFNFKDSV